MGGVYDAESKGAREEESEETGDRRGPKCRVQSAECRVQGADIRNPKPETRNPTACRNRARPVESALRRRAVRRWTEGILPGIVGAVIGFVAWGCLLPFDVSRSFALGLLALMVVLGAAGGIVHALLPEGRWAPLRRWWRVLRTLLLATAIGALVGVFAGAEDRRQRPWVMELAAGVGLLTGVFLVLMPREDREGKGR